MRPGIPRPWAPEITSQSLNTDETALEDLPSILTSSWRLDIDNERRLMNSIKNTSWTVSSLAEAYISIQLKTTPSTNHRDGHTHSLAALSTCEIIKILDDSDNLQADIHTILQNLNSVAFQQVLLDPRTSYKVLRALLAQFLTRESINSSETSASIDIDEAILRNECYIRSRGSEANRDGKGLVSLEELTAIVGSSSKTGEPDVPILIRRKDPPKGGFEFLDHHRQRLLSILPNSQAFAATFDRITSNIFRGLNWSNVFVAGGMVLRTLVHTDETEDSHKNIRDCDINVYLYGLNSEEANAKVDEIYNVWSSNLPAANSQKLIVKNAKTINFLADYPNRRIQIVLKLLPSPTQILLNFDLDACAIGFDGSGVHMLPRCARALETGYSTFTMDLIWGHYLGDRQATRETRVFSYADRGFGLRILPSYVKSLEDDGLSRIVLKELKTNPSLDESEDNDLPVEEKRPQTPNLKLSHRDYNNLEAYRKPRGLEPGLKTLKRIAYLGKDFVHRYFYGATALTMPHPDEDAEAWKEEFEKASEAYQALAEANDIGRSNHEPLESILVSLVDMDTEDSHEFFPYGRVSVGVFELFLRHCEVWLLDARADLTLDRSELSSTSYDPPTHDDIPEYTWDQNFNADDLRNRIDVDNDKLFTGLKRPICDKLQIPYQHHGYREYLTRRIRRQVHGPDLASVMEKQLTLPIIMPNELENYIVNDLLQSYPDLPQTFLDTPFSIPIHDPAKHNPATAILPSLRSSTGDNLRYWVISNDTMWACQHRAVDEIFEIMWSLFHLLNRQILGNFRVTTTSPEAIWQVLRSFRRRVVLPEIPTNGQSPIAEGFHVGRTNAKDLNIREALLFRPWVFRQPFLASPHFKIKPYWQHELFDEADYLYPVPEELFWKDGDQGDWDGEDIPQWKCVEEDSSESGKAGRWTKARKATSSMVAA